MKLKAKMEVEFEFEVDGSTTIDAALHEGRVFLQTQLHRDDDRRKFKMKRYEIEAVKET